MSNDITMTGIERLPPLISITFSDGTHLTEPSDNDLKAKLEALKII